MKLKIDEILDLLLKEMQKGKSIEDCLNEYPEFADELEPLLRLANKIEDLPKPEIKPEAVAAMLIKIGKMVAEERKIKKRFSFRNIFSLQPVIVRAIAAVLLIIFIGWAGLSFSAKSKPGDFLYSVKLFTEKVQYILTIDSEGKAELRLVFADKRTKELISSFKESEELNKELLSAMLNEAQLALKDSELLSPECSIKLVEKLKKCNCHQREVLEKIKLLVCSYDTAVINEAINLCIEQQHCIECKLNPSIKY